MSQLINHKGDLIRINPTDKQKIECSTDGGRNWRTRHSNKTAGDFNDLADSGTEIIGSTSKGVYASKDSGRTWRRKS
jgi:hypothetical protein